MVTILPFDVDEDFVRDGIAAAVAGRIEQQVRALQELASDLRASSATDREKWNSAFAALATLHDEMLPAMEWAKAFLDLWPELDEEESDDE